MMLNASPLNTAPLNTEPVVGGVVSAQATLAAQATLTAAAVKLVRAQAMLAAQATLTADAGVISYAPYHGSLRRIVVASSFARAVVFGQPSGVISPRTGGAMRVPTCSSRIIEGVS